MAKQRPTKARTEKNTGVTLERAVARIQRLIDPETTVEHDQVLTDRDGVESQFDVVIRGKRAGRNFLGVAECKDHNVKIGPALVRAFVHKARAVNASCMLMVSKKGFTDQARIIAKKEGVGTLSLLNQSPGEDGIKLGNVIFATAYRWTTMELSLRYEVAGRPLGHINWEEVKIGGIPVIRWFEKEFETLEISRTKVGRFLIRVDFQTPQTVEIMGEDRTVYQLTVVATHIYENFKWWARIYGDGLFDWDTKQLQIPGGHPFSTEGFGFNFDEWIRVEGDLQEEMDKTDQSLKLHFVISRQCFDPDAVAPDLGSLAQSVIREEVLTDDFTTTPQHVPPARGGPAADDADGAGPGGGGVRAVRGQVNPGR